MLLILEIFFPRNLWVIIFIEVFEYLVHEDNISQLVGVKGVKDMGVGSSDFCRSEYNEPFHYILI